MVHHGIFRRVRYANRRVMRVNLLLLMAVAFLPFPTKLVAQARPSCCAGHGTGKLVGGQEGPPD